MDLLPADISFRTSESFGWLGRRDKGVPSQTTKIRTIFVTSLRIVTRNDRGSARTTEVSFDFTVPDELLSVPLSARSRFSNNLEKNIERNINENILKNHRG